MIWRILPGRAANRASAWPVQKFHQRHSHQSMSRSATSENDQPGPSLTRGISGISTIFEPARLGVLHEAIHGSLSSFGTVAVPWTDQIMIKRILCQSDIIALGSPRSLVEAYHPGILGLRMPSGRSEAVLREVVSICAPI